MLHGLRRRSFRLLRRVPPPVLERAVRLGSPSYTLGTACLVEHDAKVLLVQTAYRRSWSFPGGLLDRGETPAEGTRRETLEEVGVAIDLCGEPIVLVDLGSQLVEFFFRGRLADGVDPAEVQPSSPEIEQVGWFPHDEARLLVSGPTRLREKLAFFDEMPDGGVVIVERGRRR